MATTRIVHTRSGSEYKITAFDDGYTVVERTTGEGGRWTGDKLELVANKPILLRMGNKVLLTTNEVVGIYDERGKGAR